jgi:hypothetical protein
VYSQGILKPAETCWLVFHLLTMRRIVIRALSCSFVAVSGWFRFPSPTPNISSLDIGMAISRFGAAILRNAQTAAFTRLISRGKNEAEARALVTGAGSPDAEEMEV